MRRLAFRATAKQNLSDILDYIARESGSQAVARAYVERLREQCRRLASLPATLGRPRPELGDAIRSFPAGSDVIFFRYIEDRLEVTNILERYRDVGRLAEPGEP